MLKQTTYQFSYQSGQDLQLLDERWRALMKNAAAAAQQLSYAPYSKFHVGAALQTITGDIFVAANQENAAYPLCNCAEQICVQKCYTEKPEAVIERMAIYCESAKLETTPIGPCGACRQVMLEAEMRGKGDIQILLKGSRADFILVPSVHALMPLNFNHTHLA